MTDGGLGMVRVSGPPREAGLGLGRAGRDAVHRHLLGSALWQEVTGSRHAPLARRLGEATRERFPPVWDELEGLAEGLGLPLAEVVAWNCRGDLLASVPDGCTTVLVPGDVRLLAHNEDGLPFFRGACFLAEVTPDRAPAFVAFCYPGSIPGHTFAITRAGLAQTVNNIRLSGVAPAIPRMVLGRAVLGAATLDGAVDLLREGAGSGGFHFGLAHRHDRRLLSVEFGRGAVSVEEVRAPAVHANHALHAVPAFEAQTVTMSSADRQARGDALLAAGAEPLTILRDGAGGGLPIRRDDPDDPDDENTLATAVISVSDASVDWAVFAGAAGGPEHAGSFP